MADISSILLEGSTYNIVDTTARNAIPNIEVDQAEQCLEISSGGGCSAITREQCVPQIIAAFQKENDESKIRYYITAQVPDSYTIIKYGFIGFRKNSSHPEYPNVPSFPMLIGNEMMIDYDFTTNILTNGIENQIDSASDHGMWIRPYVTIDGVTSYGEHYYFNYNTTPPSSTNPFIMS